MPNNWSMELFRNKRRATINLVFQGERRSVYNIIVQASDNWFSITEIENTSSFIRTIQQVLRFGIRLYSKSIVGINISQSQVLSWEYSHSLFHYAMETNMEPSFTNPNSLNRFFTKITGNEPILESTRNAVQILSKSYNKRSTLDKYMDSKHWKNPKKRIF